MYVHVYVEEYPQSLTMLCHPWVRQQSPRAPPKPELLKHVWTTAGLLTVKQIHQVDHKIYHTQTHTIHTCTHMHAVSKASLQLHNPAETNIFGNYEGVKALEWYCLLMSAGIEL